MSNTTYHIPELDTIRQKIDTIDNSVHDLLMERADLIMAISEAKKKQGVQIVQPAREVRMLRRLLARHHGPLPEETIIRIWRELVSSVSLLQTGLSVAVYAPPYRTTYWDMARDYFGSVLPMTRFDTPEAAFEAVRKGEMNFAILPFDLDGQHHWWNGLCQSVMHDEGLCVIQCLPIAQKQYYAHHNFPCVIVAKATFDESGDDRTLIGITSPEPVSMGSINKLCKNIGLPDGVTFTYINEQKSQMIINVPLYLQKANDQYKSLRQALMDEGIAEVVLLGGYPSPLITKISAK